MPRKPSNMYFGAQLQQIIKQYNLQTDPVKRQRLYKQHIDVAFKRVAGSLVHKYKIQQRIQCAQVVILQCVANMVEKMDGFDFERGKAFTYFTIIARNFILSQLDKGIKYNDKFKSINQVNSEGEEINLLQNCSVGSWEKDNEKSYNAVIMDHTIEKLTVAIKEDIIPSLKKQGEIDIAYAILQLIKDIDLLRNFNKKAIMLYITQMTNQDSNNINKILKKIAKHYYRIKQQVIQKDLQLLQYE